MIRTVSSSQVFVLRALPLLKIIKDSNNFVFAWVLSVDLTVLTIKTEHTQAHVPLAISDDVFTHHVETPAVQSSENEREGR